MWLLRSTKVAFVVMSFVVAVGIVFGFRYYGWIGVGLVGVLGLAISLRAEIFETYGDPHERAANDVVKMYAQQLENRRFENRDAQHRRYGDDLRRHIFHRVINAVFAAIVMLGGSMHLLREF